MAARAREVDRLPQELAMLVISSRVSFQELYDSVAQEVAAGKYSPEPFIAVILNEDLTSPANDVEAFVRAFAAAARDSWLRLLVSRGLELRALKPDALDLFRPRARRRPAARPAGSPPKTPTIALEAAFDYVRGFGKTEEFAYGLLRLVPKICLVNVTLPGGGAAQGTGFLIGPQTVLTAWHVIEPLLDSATREPVPGSERRLSVEFDFIEPIGGGSGRARVKAFNVVSDWLEDRSPCHPAERPSHSGIAAKGLETVAIDDAHLDFAVLRLQGSPGRERGVVQLGTKPFRPRAGDQVELLVFQHPTQFPQRFASGPWMGFFGNGDPAPRIRHRANTAKGSSGGLCVDGEFESVAVHQASVIDGQSKPIANQAVPTSLIAPRLVRAFHIIPELDPLSWLTTREPVLGREEFQRTVWRAVRGEKRVVTVRGPRRCGLSFSTLILRSMLPVNDNVVVEVSANEVGRDPMALATTLLERCGRKLPPGDHFPDGGAAATTPEGWLRDQLLPDLVRRIEHAAPNKKVWIVLEDLDRHDIPEDKAHELLLALMAASTDAPSVRFLLLGAKNALPGVPPALIEDDTPGWPIATQVDNYIQRLCTHHSVMMDEPQRRNWVGAVLRASAAAAGDQWQAAVQFLIQFVHPICEQK